MSCTHPSWGPARDGTGLDRCGICGALGSERRYLHVEGESRMPLIPSELLLVARDPLIGPALLELLRRVKERIDGVPASAAPRTYAPSREVVQQALELVDRIRDSHASWGGWSGIPQTCERITNMLRYGTAAGVPAPAAPNRNWWCPTCQGEVPPERVTYEETHDSRAGGCGSRVLERAPGVMGSATDQGEKA